MKTLPQKRTALIIGVGLVMIIAATSFLLSRTNFLNDSFGGSIDRASGVRAETVDDEGWVSIDSNIAVDSHNLPHISHYDQGNGTLKYARKLADGSWQREVVDDRGNCGEESGIVIDSVDQPHISYVDAASGELRYAAKIGGTWQIQVVDAPRPELHAVGNSIKLDSTGNPHITYTLSDATSNDLKIDDREPTNYPEKGLRYAYWDGVRWQKQTVWPRADDPYLALDKNDKAHISFRTEEPSSQPGDSRPGNQSPSKIVYITNTSGSWQLTEIDSETKAGGDTAIDLDSQDRAHVVYKDYGRGAVRYAKFDGSSWQTEEVAAGTGTQEGVKIAVDNQDQPRIAYVNTRDERLYVATLVGGTWEKKLIDRMGIPCIVVDALNRSHLSYGQSYEGHPDFSEEIEILRYALVE